MGIIIEHDEHERMIRLLAAHRGISEADAVGVAVRNELAREGVTLASADFLDRVRRIQDRVQTYAIDPRPADEIIGYDEVGLPR
jgi:hypothetical protein